MRVRRFNSQLLFQANMVLVSLLLHYKQIVKNEFYGYPEE